MPLGQFLPADGSELRIGSGRDLAAQDGERLHDKREDLRDCADTVFPSLPQRLRSKGNAQGTRRERLPEFIRYQLHFKLRSQANSTLLEQVACDGI